MKQNPTSPIQCKTTTPRFLIAVALALGYFALSPAPNAFAVVPAPDGGYAGANTAEGQNALLSLTGGGYNTAVGWFSLESLTTGTFNTAVGAGTLVLNTADNNTATGAGALFSNVTGGANTANGAFALFSNTAFNNTAVGAFALQFSTAANQNTAVGAFALRSTTTGAGNTAMGFEAMQDNTTGSLNTAIGDGALINNETGFYNTATGDGALKFNTTGFRNTAIGDDAGRDQTTGSDNVYVGQGMFGVAGENNACYIKSIFGQTSANGVPVLINSSNRLGTTTSSRRFKEEIKPMEQVSEVLFALKPVTFCYKKEIDPARTSQLGLIAEDVEKVSPNLVVRDKEGKPYSVRYDQVNAMLLNEFLKEHRKVQEQEATIAQLKANDVAQLKEIKALAATLKEQASQIQKVSAQLKLQKTAPQTVLNNQ
jgi:hypothetical protein